MDNKQNNKKKYRAIGNRINTLAAKANIKQKDLAKILGVHENVISYYYSGERRPDIDKLIILADYFNTSVDYILGRTDIESVDADIKMICNHTGLSEEAVEKLHSLYNDNDKRIEIDFKYEAIINQVICSDFFVDLLKALYALSFNSALLVNTDFESIVKLKEHELHDVKVKRLEATEALTNLLNSYDCTYTHRKEYEALKKAIQCKGSEPHGTNQEEKD